MPILSVCLLAERNSDAGIAARFDDFNVVVTDLGHRVEAYTRTDAIARHRHLPKDKLMRLRLVLGPDGQRCTYDDIDINNLDLYSEFDVLFSAPWIDVNALYEAIASLVTGWRQRGEPRVHWVAVPRDTSPDEHDD